MQKGAASYSKLLINKMNCNICSAGTYTIYIKRPIRKLHYCRSCEFISADKAYVPDYYASKERYLKHNNSYNDKAYIAYIMKFLESNIFPLLRENSRILDYGCGYEPVISKILSEKGIDTFKYDPFFFTDNSFKGKTFNLIILHEVLEHMQDPAAELMELKKLLEDKGSICISTLLHKGKQEDINNWWYLKDITHISFFSPNTISALATRTGLKLIKTDGQKYIELGS